MVELGLGKNMVRSLRFWVEAAGIAQPADAKGLEVTRLGSAVFGDNGFDPYLEDVRTLWLLHWNLSSRTKGALFAWRFLLNQWPYPEFTRSEALAAFIRESSKLGYAHSPVTLSQHLDVFLHTYHSSRSANLGIEDSLDAALVELSLLESIGERKAEGGRWESVYAFRREPKPEITPALFIYCVADFWARFHPNDDTLTLREVAVGLCSPGQVLKLPEDDVRARLEEHAAKNPRHSIAYMPSAVQGLLTRRAGAPRTSLAEIYRREAARG